MRYLAAIPLLLLVGCNDRPESRAPQPTATPSPTQTSIIRPDVAPPEPTATPLAPIEVTIGFADSETELSPQAIADLERLVASDQLAQGGPITIGAHTDSAGSDAANLSVSRKRGELVRDWLVAKGVDEKRITVVAFGEQNPAQPNALPDGSPNEAGRRANRRVEIRVGVRPVAAAPTREPTVAEELGDKTAPTSTP